MIRGIFKRRGTDHKAERRERGRQTAPASVRQGARAQVSAPVGASQTDSVTPPDITIDETMVALSRELSGLAQMEVGRAAKERGWATIQRELERHPVRPAASAVKGASRGTGAAHPVRAGAGAQGRTASTGTRRWILGSAAAAVAVIAILLGTYSAGLLTAGDGEGPGPSTSVVSSEGTEVTTPTTDGQTSGTTEGPSTTGPNTSGTTEATAPTETTAPGPGSSDTTIPSGTTTPVTGPDTTGGSVTTERPTSTGPSTPTTQPQTTTTTGEQQYAAAQRAETAKAAVFDLAALVVDYFVTGDMSGARALVASGAQSQLVQMISSLRDPYGFRWVSTKELATDKLRVTLEFNDRVPDGRGELKEVAKRFFLIVRVNEVGGALSAAVTAISAGS